MDNLITHDEPRWYAVSTRARHEKAAASMLENLGIRHFLPLMTTMRRWSDRKQTVVSPLFPCYFFVHISNSAESRLRVLKIPGVVRLVGNPHGPVAIPDYEIESLQVVLSQGIGCLPCPYLEPGDRVRILRGVLAGIEGTFLRCGRDTKLVLSIEMIQRSVAINIDGCDVERISHGSRLYAAPANTGAPTMHPA